LKKQPQKGRAILPQYINFPAITLFPERDAMANIEVIFNYYIRYFKIKKNAYI